jgi:hypothetical protein
LPSNVETGAYLKLDGNGAWWRDPGAAGPAPQPQWKITVENIGGAFASIP